MLKGVGYWLLGMNLANCMEWHVCVPIYQATRAGVCAV